MDARLFIRLRHNSFMMESRLLQLFFEVPRMLLQRAKICAALAFHPVDTSFKLRHRLPVLSRLLAGLHCNPFVVLSRRP
jgi:hypothetical protein